MAEEEEDAPMGELAEGPGKEYEIYIKSEEFVEKLKLLDYESGFLKMNAAYRPIQRHYFVRSTNAGEQFFLFTALAGWLIRVGGNSSFEMPQEFDDPNSTVAGILSELRAKGAAVDFPANKLKNGAGEHCLSVLDQLADLALVHTGFRWQRMVPPVVEDDDDGVDGEEEEEEEADSSSEPELAEDDDEGAVLVDLHAPSVSQTDDEPLQEILHSDVDVSSWRQEVERVGPQLKITIRQDAKDWRMHLEQMSTMHKNMSDLVNGVNPQLDKISDELEKALERIESREKSLNQQLSGLMQRFRKGLDARAENVEKYKRMTETVRKNEGEKAKRRIGECCGSSSVGVTDRTAALQRVSDDLDQLKQQIEEEGAKNSDGAPMVKIKQALAKMEGDIQRMNVQIGVIEQALLQGQLRSRVAYSQEGYGAY